MDDFERRRELRRQKREEMRLEAERLSYQRNDDDEEEAARERRRRARQERLRQKEEGDLSGEVMEKSEVNAQNCVAEEETKRTTTTGGTDDEAALLERLARREERRQKRLQEALERQKEFDPTITDGSLSLPSRKEVNNMEENETTGKEEKAETRRGRYEIEETEMVTKSYQRNNWRQEGEEEEKKEEKDKEEVQEEKPKEVPIEENQVDVTAEKSTRKEEVVETKNIAINAEEHKAENYTNAVLEGEQSISDAVNEEKFRDEEKAQEKRKEAEEGEKLEAEERERLKAEEEKKATEEKQKAEEEKRAAEERERAKAEEEKRAAEERARAKAEEEKRAAEERARAKAEEEKRAAEERARAKAEEEKRAAEERARAKAEEEKRAAEEKAKLEAEKLKEKQKMEEKKIEDKQVKEKKVQEEKPQAAFLRKQVKDDKDKGKAPKEEMKSVWDRKKGVPEQKAQNGERELSASKLKSTENAFGRSSLKGTASAEEAKPGSLVEAGKRLEDQRHRRGENEEFEKLKEKQQEAAAELDELKKRREERRKILEEEEQKKKQEEAERKAREEEEKRRMKEEIERRRAEAAEKRQKMPEDGVSEDKKPFKCFSPKGSSLKIEERAEFLNKSAQKSGMKPTHTTAVVSKIDSRLEQYTSAIEGTKAARPTKPAASDLPVPAEGVRNIKSMWEKGNVFSSPSGTGTPNKETAGLKVGVSSRINEWLTKTPDSNKSPAPKPSDLKPGDVSSKRNLWEKQSVEKPATSSKVSAMGKKTETNAGLRQFEKEP
ncbi:caldesmon isoform X4 [Athene noctua]|uniref:caldesmon isoform X4 n=1 Tax=Athene noctua TaxID=126797 RepID=UPI003EB944B5